MAGLKAGCYRQAISRICGTRRCKAGSRRQRCENAWGSRMVGVTQILGCGGEGSEIRSGEQSEQGGKASREASYSTLTSFLSSAVSFRDRLSARKSVLRNQAESNSLCSLTFRRTVCSCSATCFVPPTCPPTRPSARRVLPNPRQCHCLIGSSPPQSVLPGLSSACQHWK